jgi:hypothetical protein
VLSIPETEPVYDIIVNYSLATYSLICLINPYVTNIWFLLKQDSGHLETGISNIQAPESNPPYSGLNKDAVRSLELSPYHTTNTSEECNIKFSLPTETKIVYQHIL